MKVQVTWGFNWGPRSGKSSCEQFKKSIDAMKFANHIYFTITGNKENAAFTEPVSDLCPRTTLTSSSEGWWITMEKLP